MRVLVAELKQETNSFVPYLTKLAQFENWHLWEGDQILAEAPGLNWEVTGFLDVLAEAGIEAVPAIATMAISGGSVEQATFDDLLGRLLAHIAQAGEIDGMLLALHGAMVSEEHEDADGVIAKAVRTVIGPDIPLVISLDLHANITRQLVTAVDAIAGFKTAPHIDHRDTGQRAARMLVQQLRGEAKPVMRMIKIPMVTPASTHLHHLPGPFQRLMEASKAYETGDVLAATLFTVQPWLDIDEFGFASVVVTNHDPELAQRVATELAQSAWDERAAFFETKLVPPADAIERALAVPSGPVVMAEVADGNGAGSPGDATAVIAALLEVGPPKTVLATMHDGEAARAAFDAGVGAEVDLMVGGKLDHIYNQPIRYTGVVEFAGPASFKFGGGGYTGLPMDMGLTAVVRHEGLHLVITSNSCFTIDPEIYRAVGLDPLNAQIVIVKSAGQFRSGYSDIASEIILLDSPGMSSDRLETYDFTRVPRPLYPLDAATEFTP
jgi:microcystin degradation protein MlrC